MIVAEIAKTLEGSISDYVLEDIIVSFRKKSYHKITSTTTSYLAVSGRLGGEGGGAGKKGPVLLSIYCPWQLLGWRLGWEGCRPEEKYITLPVKQKYVGLVQCYS